MADEKVVNYKIRYKVEIVLFTEVGNDTIIPVRLKGLTKHVDYSKHFSPILTANLLLSVGHVKIIKNNQDTLLAKFTVTKIKYIENTESLKDRHAVEEFIVYDTIMVPIIEAEDIVNLREMEDTVAYPSDKDGLSIEESYSDGLDRRMNLYEVRVYLSSLEYHRMYKKSYNTILRGKDGGLITVDSALKYICETCGVGGYIVDMPDNNYPQQNIIIPSGNVKYCLDMLQKMYGIYLKDMVTFYDLDSRMYVLNKFSSLHEYEEGFPRTVNLSVGTNKESTNHGSCSYLDDGAIVHSIFKGIQDESISIAAGEAYGDSIVFTNFGMGQETFINDNGKLKNVEQANREFLRRTLSHAKTGLGMSFEYDELNNPYNMFSELEAVGITSMYIVSADGMDLNCLKPNVVYTIRINSDNEKDNGRYDGKTFSLMSYTQQFVRDNELGGMDQFKTFETLLLADTN